MDKSSFGQGARPAIEFPDPIAVLRRVEWLGWANGHEACPVCRNNEYEGCHKSNCDLAAVLRAHANLAPPAARG